jgi:hypothetical protein
MGLKLIDNPLFYVINKDTYPPFKNGLYLEEYFLNFMKENSLEYDNFGRRYIPILWTNFQIEHWFNNMKNKMQSILDSYILEYPCEKGYFTVVQHDDGPMLKLPENTVIYGACSGNIPLPLIYEDLNHNLENISTNSLKIPTKLCSFVGTLTHNIRKNMVNELSNTVDFDFKIKGYWSAVVEDGWQKLFIDTTLDSKFALAPRGYGRSSFRFFEIFLLGRIPIYIWDDIEWLPYKDKIDYSKICISIHSSRINELPSILSSITQEHYYQMIQYYNSIKHIFELKYMCEYIINR